MDYRINKSKLEETSCPICKNNSNTLQYVFEPFRLVKCNNCNLLYLNPRLNEEYIYEHYSEDEFYNNYSAGTGYEIQENSLRGTFKKFLKVLEKKGLIGGKLLEVGCGFGYLLDLSKKFYLDCVGTDFSESAVNKAREFCNNVYCGGIDSIPDDLGTFDYIIAFSVIEHVYNPNEFIEQVSKKLNKGGTLIIATPDVGSYWSKLLKKKWPFHIPTEHVCLYEKNTLECLLKNNNFSKINSFSFTHGWPVVTFISKIGFEKLAYYISKTYIGKKAIYVPNTIICTYGIKN